MIPFDVVQNEQKYCSTPNFWGNSWNQFCPFPFACMKRPQNIVNIILITFGMRLRSRGTCIQCTMYILAVLLDMDIGCMHCILCDLCVYWLCPVSCNSGG